MNTIYLRKRSKVTIPEGSGTTPIEVLATLQKNLEGFGFLLSADVIERLKSLGPAQVESFYQRLVKDLKVMVGYHREFAPMYPNFPTQVMETSEAELYFNAILHYLTLDRRQFPIEERPPLEDRPRIRVIGLGTREDFESIFTLLSRSRTPYSPADKADVQWFVAQYRERIHRLIAGAIPCKENLAVLGAELIRNTADAAPFLNEHVKTATDVLRLAVALNDGDASLARACPYGKFRRRERVLLLGLIERAPSRIEDMLRWKPRWIRLGEYLHPGEYAARFPKTAEAFDILRNDRPFATFNGQVETALLRKDTPAALGLLDARPGELTRRLDHLARTSPDPDAVVGRFEARAEGVSTPVLLQAMTHFRQRGGPGDLRIFFPKGEVANLFASSKPLPTLAPEVCDELAAICERTLLNRFAQRPALGKCYLDPRLGTYLVPFSQRSASKSLRTLVRGSRLPLPGGSTLRFFVWWKNGKSRVDIDLSAAMYSTDFKHVDTLAYYNLKNFGAHHSGDIIDAPEGASEFIDIDLQLCADKGVRYVAMCLSSFTAQPYCDLPECFAGWMAREAPGSGEIFEPKTVVDKVDLASDTQFCIPAFFDIEGCEVLWADIALEENPRFVNNVHNNLSGVSLMLRAMKQLRKTDLRTLFDLHIRARGEAVPTPEAADSVFAVDQGLTPFDLDRITADYL